MRKIWILIILINNTIAIDTRNPNVLNISKTNYDDESTTVVEEFVGGSLDVLYTQIILSELSLTLLYVPWSPDCLLAKKKYHDVARLYYQQVYFSAVDCRGRRYECRTQFSGVDRWPRIVAFIKGKNVGQYDGIWNTYSISKFIEGLLRPLVRIHDQSDLAYLMKRSLYVVVGIFESVHTYNYVIYVKAALKWLEIDPNQVVCFSVHIQPSRARVENATLPPQLPAIKMVNEYTSEILAIDDKWSVNKIIDRVKRKCAISVYSFKAVDQVKLLTTLLHEGPVLLTHYSHNTSKQQLALMKDIVSFYRDNNTTETRNDDNLTCFLCISNQTEPTDASRENDLRPFEIWRSENETLSFLLMNKHVFSEILTRLSGIPQSHVQVRSSALIIDRKNEQIIPMVGNFTNNSIISALTDFQKGNLASNRTIRRDLRRSEERRHPPSDCRIDDLDHRAFLNILAQSNLTTVALIYSSSCSLCTLMSSVLLQVASKFTTESVKFVRIDASINDLPWIYNMEKEPTLIIFPLNRTMDSAVFPPNMKISFRNVYLFVLSHLSADEQVASVINTCEKMQPSSGRVRKCMMFAKRLLHRKINSQFVHWNLFKHQRQEIRELLMSLKHISDKLLSIV